MESEKLDDALDSTRASEMRVLLVSGVYPPAIGGPSAQTRAIAQELTDRGVQVRVLTQVREAEDAAVEVATLTLARARSAREWIGTRATLLRSLRRHLDAFRPTIVHVQTLGPIGIAALLIAHWRGIPTLAKYPGSAAAEATRGGSASALEGMHQSRSARGRRWVAARLATAREQLAFRLADRIWVTTPTVAAGLAAERSKIWVQHNFLDLTPFNDARARRRSREGPTSGATRLLLVARLKPHKGVHIAIRALARLPPRFTLTVVGDGDPVYERRLRDLVIQYDIADRVLFVGRVPAERVAQWYEEADLFLLPSFEEAFGIALVEAAAAGVPSVASDVGGVPDVVADGHTGWLVSAGDAAALARAVEALDTDPHPYQPFAENAYARAVTYGLPAGIEALLRTYLQLCRR